MHSDTRGKRDRILLVWVFVAVPLAVLLVCIFAALVARDGAKPQSAEETVEESVSSDGIDQPATPGGALFQVGDRLSAHERRIWKMAVAMAAAGYHLDRSLDDRGAPINYISTDEALRFVNAATIGTRYLGRVDPHFGEDVTYWRLDRGFEREENVRSFLAVEARRSFDRRMYDAMWTEWTRWVGPYTEDPFFPETHPGADLLDDLWSIYEADRRAGWNTDRPVDQQAISASIEVRSYSEYDLSSRYDLRLSTKAGDYRLEAYLWTTFVTKQGEPWRLGEMEEPFARLVLWFTYCPQHEPK
jgi:hypothetical protein